MIRRGFPTIFSFVASRKRAVCSSLFPIIHLLLQLSVGGQIAHDPCLAAICVVSRKTFVGHSRQICHFREIFSGPLGKEREKNSIISLLDVAASLISLLDDDEASPVSVALSLSLNRSLRLQRSVT